MPILSLFYGIVVRMYTELGGKHHVPHIHVEYQDYKAVYDLEGNVLEGDIPNKQHNLVKAWISLHDEDLKADWKILQEGRPSFRIPPLQ